MKHIMFGLVAISACAAPAAMGQSAAITGNVSKTTGILPGEKITIELYAAWSGIPNATGFGGIDGYLDQLGGHLEFVSFGELPIAFIEPPPMGPPPGAIWMLSGQLPSIINPEYVTSNPVNYFVATWESATPGTYDISTVVNQFVVYTGTLGGSMHILPTEFSVQVTVIPAPSSVFALLASACALVARRRR